MTSFGPGGDGTPGSSLSCPTAGAFVLPGGYTIGQIREIGGISHNGGSGAVIDNIRATAVGTEAGTV